MKETKTKKSKPTQQPQIDQPAVAPTCEAIATLAYLIWEHEGRPQGKQQEHWLQAEAQLRHADKPSSVKVIGGNLAHLG